MTVYMWILSSTSLGGLHGPVKGIPLPLIIIIIIIIIIRVFWPRAGPSLQVQKPRLQFCRRLVFHRKLRRPRMQFYQGLNKCGSFPLLSTPHSPFSIWTDLKRSEKSPGAQAWRWGEWIWVTGPSGLHRNQSQGLNISSLRVLTRSEIRKKEPNSPYKFLHILIFTNYLI